jgi:hypothetical protein
MSNLPSASEVVGLASLPSSFATLTDTPGNRAPEASSVVPANAPVDAVWQQRGVASPTQTANMATNRQLRNLFQETPGLDRSFIPTLQNHAPSRFGRAISMKLLE